MLQKCGHFGILVYGALHWQKAASELLNEANVHHVAGDEKKHMLAICIAFNILSFQDKPYKISVGPLEGREKYNIVLS